jgi:hypothetical protein
MLIYWFAFPTYTVAYLWVYMALACRDAMPLPRPPAARPLLPR